MTRSQRRDLGEWTPGNQLGRLRNQINRLFEFPFGADLTGPSSLEAWSPVVDVFENKDHVTVKAEVPGMRKEDIDVSVEGNTLSICGERREQKERSLSRNQAAKKSNREVAAGLWIQSRSEDFGIYPELRDD